MRNTLLAVLLCVPFTAATAQSAKNAKPLVSASAVTCEDAGENYSKPVKSRVGFTASVEVKAVREGKGKERRCITSWILRASGPQMASTSTAVQTREDKPSDNEWGYENGFDVIGWSKDGVRLLTAAVQAGGDWDETTPIVYDFQTHKSWRVDGASIFSKVVPKDCLVYFRPVRFAPTGEVVILVAPFEDDARCFVKSLWSLDYERQTVQKIRDAK